LIVLDASAVVELLLNTSTGQRVALRLRELAASLHAPHLIDLEVAQVGRRLVRDNIINRERGAAMIADLGALELERHAHDVLLPRIWALGGHVSAYDAAYLALAEALDVPLLTADERLGRASGHRAQLLIA